jgi:hypothetical protein
MNVIRWPVRVIGKVWRRRRLAQLLDDLQLWEMQGRDLLAQVVELTEPGDDLHEETARVLDLLSGP